MCATSARIQIYTDTPKFPVKQKSSRNSVKQFTLIFLFFFSCFSQSNTLLFTVTFSLIFIIIRNKWKIFTCLPFPESPFRMLCRCGSPVWVAILHCHRQWYQRREWISLRTSLLIGFHQHQTSSYHRKFTVFVKRFRRTLNSVLKTTKNYSMLSVPIVLLSLRCFLNYTGYL